MSEFFKRKHKTRINQLVRDDSSVASTVLSNASGISDVKLGGVEGGESLLEKREFLRQCLEVVKIANLFRELSIDLDARHQNEKSNLDQNEDEWSEERTREISELREAQQTVDLIRRELQDCFKFKAVNDDNTVTDYSLALVHVAEYVDDLSEECQPHLLKQLLDNQEDVVRGIKSFIDKLTKISAALNKSDDDAIYLFVTTMSPEGIKGISGTYLPALIKEKDKIWVCWDDVPHGRKLQEFGDPQLNASLDFPEIPNDAKEDYLGGSKQTISKKVAAAIRKVSNNILPPEPYAILKVPKVYGNRIMRLIRRLINALCNPDKRETNTVSLIFKATKAAEKINAPEENVYLPRVRK